MMEEVNVSYIIDPHYACKYYDLPSKEICTARYPPVKPSQTNFNLYWGYFSAIIMLMQNPFIARIILKYWALIVILGCAFWDLMK